MKTIYLLTNCTWSKFEYETLSDLSDEFAKRGVRIGRNAFIGYGAFIGDGVRIGYDAHIGSSEVVKSIVISGSRHIVSYWGADCIQIGCKQYSIAGWQKHFRAVGKAECYTPEQIEEYGGYIEMIANYHKKHTNHEPI